MEDTALEAEIREAKGTGAARRAKRAGIVPCVIYGLGGENLPLSIPRNKLESVLRTGKRMVDLRIGTNNESVLVKELQFDPITSQVIHADFARVAMDEEVSLDVPITITGKAKGVADDDGVLDQTLKSMQIQCLPGDIPDEIVVDVSELGLNDLYKVQDIDVPTGVTAMSPADDIVVVVHPPAAEEEETLSDEVASTEPEVLTAAEPGKDEEGKQGDSKKE